MKMNKIILLVFVALIYTPASATIINIPDDYSTIQAGINASENGDTVLVQPGTYVENINFNGHNIVLGSLFLTTGDTSYISQTVIDGDSAGSVVIFESGEDSTSIVKGFAIRNGLSELGGGIFCYEAQPIISNNQITSNQGVHGAGIECNHSNATILRNVLYMNTASLSGGGIHCQYSQPVIQNNKIHNNNANYGGGISLGRSNAEILNNTINNNTAEIDGGGINIWQENPIIISNLFDGNLAYGNGGAISCSRSDAIIENCNMVNNEADLDGGAISLLSFANPEIINNLILNNCAGHHGGAIYYQVSSNPMIVNNNISENNAIKGGGICGISISSINDNTINSNSALFGGGIYINQHSNIMSNEIYDNISPFGGAIYCKSSAAQIISNNIHHNSSSMRGAGIYCYDNANPLVAGNTIHNNLGNAIYCWYSSPTIQNNIIYANNGLYGTGIYLYSSSPLVYNTIIRDNGEINESGIQIEENSYPLIFYCNLNEVWPGEGNINVDPLFRDPENWDFHLMATYCDDAYDSPCIDMGHPDILDSLLDCDWGLGELRSDMGAYGGGEGYVDIDYNDIVKPKKYFISQNYPNPFNTSTTISYILLHSSDVTLDIYDILGRKAQTLYNGNQPAGSHSVIWNADGFSSGIYFYKLTAGEYKQTQKMMLLK